MRKSELRVEVLAKRNKLSKKAVLAKSYKIFKKFSKLSEILKLNNFLLYLPIRNEADTSAIIEFLQSKNKRISLPVFDKKSRDYKISLFGVEADLDGGPFKIAQPANLQIVSIDEVDVAIIPGVAFDKGSNRLGYGKGVYDRLLADFKGLKVGLAYDFQIVEELPFEDYDLKVDMIVTEENIYRI